VTSRWNLPKHDYWSTPFAEALLEHLELYPGATILDVASGHGIPAFTLADRVGAHGRVLAIDDSEREIAGARRIQGDALPWLEFARHDMRALPSSVGLFDRITGNLSVMFFRPDRFKTLQGLITHLKPGGQIVLTFPSLGTFESLWQRIDREMASRGCSLARQRLAVHVAERPSAKDAEDWLKRLGLERIVVTEKPLEVATGPGVEFLHHPLLRAGFLDDVYECFEDRRVADAVMTAVSEDLPSFTPLIAQRCVMVGWKRTP